MHVPSVTLTLTVPEDGKPESVETKGESPAGREAKPGGFVGPGEGGEYGPPSAVPPAPADTAGGLHVPFGFCG